MNIVELTEKSSTEVAKLFTNVKSGLYTALNRTMPTYDDIKRALENDSPDSYTYLLADKISCYALVTVNKDLAEIQRLWIDFATLDEGSVTKFLDFAIKQFSAITFVFIWLDSVDTHMVSVLEDYGFEYTGEQDYLDKQLNILKFKYAYKRKK